MKNFVCLVSLGLLLIQPVRASELFGQITTAPNNQSNITTSTPVTKATGSSALLPLFLKPPSRPVVELTATKTAEVVLGRKVYGSGSLLKDQRGRIYLIENGRKLPIRNLLILGRFKGRKISSVPNEYLAQLKSLSRKNGQLVRVTGQKKIFVLRRDGKRPIKNLKELATTYRGLIVLRISSDELLTY